MCSEAEQQQRELVAAAAAVTEEVRGDDELVRKIVRIILNGQKYTQPFIEYCLKRLNHFLVEFGTTYVSLKTNEQMAPSSMMSYIRGIQQRLREIGFDVNLFSEPTFKQRKSGF